MVNWAPGMTLAELEKLVIIAALRFYDGNKNRTAVGLGLSPRTIDNKLKEYGHKPEEEEQLDPPNPILAHYARQNELLQREREENNNRARGVRPESLPQVSSESPVPVQSASDEEIQKMLLEQASSIPSDDKDTGKARGKRAG